MDQAKKKFVSDALLNIVLGLGASLGIGFGSHSVGYGIATFCLVTLWLGNHHELIRVLRSK
jgi:hypothetical protein